MKNPVVPGLGKKHISLKMHRELNEKMKKSASGLPRNKGVVEIGERYFGIEGKPHAKGLKIASEMAKNKKS